MWTALYLMIQWAVKGSIQDGLFLLLLTLATIFVNYSIIPIVLQFILENGCRVKDEVITQHIVKYGIYYKI